jgi:glycine oxidase
MEHVGFDASVTDSGIEELLANGTRLFPALAGAGPVRRWAGLRPMTPDGYPIVGADPEVRGLWYATGHGRNGVLLAVLTGQIISDLLTAGSTDVDIASLDVTRFT